MAVLGIWDQNICNYSGPYSDNEMVGGLFEVCELRSMFLASQEDVGPTYAL